MVMKPQQDTLLVASRLVDELGADAIRVSRVKLVEVLAANNQRAAAFWREVLDVAEMLLSDARPAAARAERQPPQV